MQELNAFIEGNFLACLVTLAIAFVVLTKCADLFVDAAVAMAEKFGVPKLVIGIVLVSLCTTIPEVSVSVIAALRGNPEMALGNAIGSVICDDGIALALAGIFAAAPIAVLPKVLKTSGIFLIGVEILIFVFLLRWGVEESHTLNRLEGGILLALLFGYLYVLYRQNRSGKEAQVLETEVAEIEESSGGIKQAGVGKTLALFAAALAGVIVSSHFIVIAATGTARYFGIPEAVIALTVVAIGTSIPEIATCIISARKGHGEIAIGNIVGADIMNICWVAALSSLVQPLTLQAREFWFMFPSMFIIVGAMLLMLRHKYQLTRTKGVVLLALYGVYVVSFYFVFKPGA